MVLGEHEVAGFAGSPTEVRLDYPTLMKIYAGTPGLAADRLKAVLETVAKAVANESKRGMIFAYDEAQNLADAQAKDQYPLSLLLDVFQSIQRKGIPFMLVLTGLPTLFPKLVEARTYSERMFHVLTLDKLSREDSEEAILKPIKVANCPVQFDDGSVATGLR